MPKRQKLTNQSFIQPIPPTAYDVPQELLINFPSSIVNGITKENGLVSLTLKSVACAQLVEEMTWLHSILFNTAEEPTRIIDKDLDLKSRLAQLQSEVNALKATKNGGQVTTGASPETLSKDLDSSLESIEKFETFKNKLFEDYSKTHPETVLSVSNGLPYNKIEGIKFNVHVDKKKDEDIPIAKENAEMHAENSLEQAPISTPVVSDTISTPNPLEAESETPTSTFESLLPGNPASEPYVPTNVEVPPPFNAFP
ncbi:hypothetical protein CLIB1423_02S03312 [[Candida] railenensis]|uniref:Uncharacterized protein n=1 Tax=[Candida] railenensis TaxID=45579 RepID=A0A9P0QL85_9ASCO|nr:hypothetical protein CLIB1423_02S03312 [[Candida] railenensis]